MMERSGGERSLGYTFEEDIRMPVCVSVSWLVDHEINSFAPGLPPPFFLPHRPQGPWAEISTSKNQGKSSVSQLSQVFYFSELHKVNKPPVGHGTDLASHPDETHTVHAFRCVLSSAFPALLTTNVLITIIKPRQALVKLIFDNLNQQPIAMNEHNLRNQNIPNT